MPRKNRLLVDNGFYHVFNRGISRKYIQFSKDYQVLFFNQLEISLQRYNVQVHAYCLMSNHYHLLVRTPSGNLDKFMQYFGAGLSRRVNRLLGADGSLFRSRYKSVFIKSDSYMLQLLKYIHFNPVEAGLVEHPYEYPLSSYNEYLSSNSSAWLEMRYFKKCFVDRVAFEQYHETPPSEKIQKIYSKKQLPDQLI